MRLVLDTNVVLDWLLFEDPSAGALRDAAQRRQVTIYTHQSALEELRRVIGRLELDAVRRAQVLGRYQAATTWFPGVGGQAEAAGLPAGFPHCRDPDDDPFLVLAYRSGADALVSRDREVLALERRMRAYGVAIWGVPHLEAALAPLRGAAVHPYS